MKRLIAFLLTLLAAPALSQGFDHSHAAWDALVRKHVVLVQGGKAPIAHLDYDWSLNDLRK